MEHGTETDAGVVRKAWDVAWDPDERHDLLAASPIGDPSYLGDGANADSLKRKFADCVDYYWGLNATTGEWLGTGACAWSEPALP